jgi:peptide/nickel transport system permease protein
MLSAKPSIPGCWEREGVMVRYAVYRVFQAIPTLIGIMVISFLIAHLAPGGPAEALLGNRSTPQLVAAINRELGLNKPLWVQFGLWLWQLLHGNFGQSYILNQPVSVLFEETIPRTLAIVGISTILANLFAIWLGTFQAYHKNTWYDHVISGLSYFLYSMPTFWLGALFLMWFAVDHPWFPVMSQPNPTQPHTFGLWVQDVTLPIMTLFFTSVAGYARYMRTSVSDTMVQDYIRTARAKGLPERTVLFKHALRNSILPQITLFGLSLPSLLAGAVFVEEIFNYPGMGMLTFQATIDKDYPIIMAAVVLTGVLTIVGNLIADLLYAVVDPRIQYN